MGLFTTPPPPQPEPALSPPLSANRSLTASAARLRINDRRSLDTLRSTLSSAESDWQSHAWESYNCADADTEILTQDGWRTHDKLTPGDMVRVLAADGRARWEPLLDIHVYDVIDAPMLSIEQRAHSSLTTADHRWPVQEMRYADGTRAGFDNATPFSWSTSKDLRAEVRFITAAPPADTPTTEKHSDALVEVVAWYWTEGNVRRDRDNPQVSITQSLTVNPDNCARIRGALTELFGPASTKLGWDKRRDHTPQWSESVAPNRTDVLLRFSLNIHASRIITDIVTGHTSQKTVSRAFLRELTYAQLLLFLDVSDRADGHLTKKGTRVLTQNSAHMAENYEYAAILAGLSTHITATEYGDYPRHTVFIHQRTTATPRKRHRQWVSYTGTVWCPETPSGSWLARRNGTVYYTGNSLGELHFAFNLIANLISRIRFYPAAEISPNVAPAFVLDAHDLTPGIAQAAVTATARLGAADIQEAPSGANAHATHGATSDLSPLARTLALNFCVTGECYLVQVPAATNLTPEGVQHTPERWDVFSGDEIHVTSDGVFLRSQNSNSGAGAGVKLPKDAFIARIWRRHPRYSYQADSSVRAVLPLIDELLLVNQTFRSIARSRLNSGILFVPDGLSASTPALPPSPEDALQPAPADIDEFEESLIEGMMTPISDPSDASAVVPILVRGPEDLGDKIRLINFERTFDPTLVQRSDRLLDRILQGLDLPKEIVAGISDTKYANAYSIDENLLKSHVEPLALLICDTITDVYLRPALQAYGYTPQQAARIRIWYDPSEVVTRPNRNQDAISAFDRFALSARSLREATGFNESDAPTPSELILRMLLMKGPVTPELGEALMRAIAPLTMKTATDAAAEGSSSALPQEVQDLLNGVPSSTGTPETAEAEAEAVAPEAEAAPAAPPAPTPQGPRAGRAAAPTPRNGAEVDLGDGISLLPPAPPQN